MKVHVVFDFPKIDDPNSKTADWVIQVLTQMTAEWSADLQDCHVYVDDAIAED